MVQVLRESKKFCRQSPKLISSRDHFFLRSYGLNFIPVSKCTQGSRQQDEYQALLLYHCPSKRKKKRATKKRRCRLIAKALLPFSCSSLKSGLRQCGSNIFKYYESDFYVNNTDYKMIQTVTGEDCNFGVKGNDVDCDFTKKYGSKLIILPPNDQIKELQTILRDRTTSRSDFKFYADRLIRLVIEESLNQLPFSKCDVITPTGAKYEGLQYKKGNCGVSIIRSGEAMEQGLRDCCRSIRIGKILVESDLDTHEARVVYARFPDDIAERKVLLMYPIMGTGNTVSKAVAVLKEHNVAEENIILSNLFCTPPAAKSLTAEFPDMTILTSEIYPVAPNHFGQKYFGTD